MATTSDFFEIYSKMWQLVHQVFENSGASNIELVNFCRVLFTIHITVRYRDISGEEKTVDVKAAESCLDWGKNWKKAIARNKKNIFG